MRTVAVASVGLVLALLLAPLGLAQDRDDHSDSGPSQVGVSAEADAPTDPDVDPTNATTPAPEDVEPGVPGAFDASTEPSGAASAEASPQASPSGPSPPGVSLGINAYVACEFVFVATVCPTRVISGGLGPDDPPSGPVANETTAEEVPVEGEDAPAETFAAAEEDAALDEGSVEPLAAGPSEEAPRGPDPTSTGVGPPVPAKPPGPLGVAHLPEPSTQWKVAAAAAAAAVVLVPSILLKLAGIVVLRRRTQSPVAAAIVSAIAAEPGVRHVELVRRIGRGNGTVEHHVARLLRMGVVQRVRRGAATFYYLGGQDLQADDHRRMALQGATARRIVDALQASPGVSLVELAAQVGISVSTAHYHIRRLAGAGLVQDSRGGWRRSLSLAEGGPLPMPSASDAAGVPS